MPSPESPSTTAPAFLVDVRWGVAHPLNRVCTGIGRADTNPILIRDAAASRVHCEVQRNADQFTVHPIGDADTRLNGLLLTQPKRLEEGDEIEVAYTHLRFTRKPPEGDIVLAQPHGPVEFSLASQTTGVREVLSPERMSQLREKMLDQVELHWYVILGAVIGSAVVLTILIRLAIHLLRG
jgi:pSer/pThr/pTyr-binding forkhead associated (FHA) protein